jgi:drug/metabolite transporter (DMT)-like permease
LAGAPLPRHPVRGYLLISAATLCWGGAANFGKAVFSGRLFAGQEPISPLVLTQARTTIAALVLGIFLLLWKGPRRLRMTARDLRLCAFIAVFGLAGSNFFYYWAVQKTAVAIAITVQYTAPVWVLLFMVARRRQKATLGRVAAVLLALSGVALASGVFSPDVHVSRMGVLAALLAAFSFSVYTIGAQDLVARNHPLHVMCYALLSSALLWLCVNPPWRLLRQHYSAGQWGFLFLFACFSTLLPYTFYFNGLKYLDPTRAIITSSLEPVFAALFAAVFLGEALGGMQMTGMAAVMMATILAQRSA